jgi:flavin-dependent dehydrogenase
MPVSHYIGAVGELQEKSDGQHWSVIVIGAGPAGSYCAELLASEGRRVLVIDRRSDERTKLCGGLLNRRAQQQLSRLGEMPESVRRFSDRPGLEFLPLEYQDIDNRIRARYDPGYRNISRPALDAWLSGRAAAAGAQFRLQASVGELAQAPQNVTLTVGDDVLTADWVIDASGSAGFSRRRLGGPGVNKLHALQGAVELEPEPDAMWAVYKTAYTPFFSWLVPKGGGNCLLGTALTHGGLMKQREAAGGQGGWELLKPLFEHIESRGYRIVSRLDQPRGAVLTCPRSLDEIWWGQERLIAIGEAAGLVSPHSGEGISYALACAEAASFAVLSGGGAQLMPRITTQVLSPLRLAFARAWVAEHPWLRPWALMLLPLVTGQPLSYARWDETAEDV